MSNKQRIALLAAALVVGVVGFVLARPGDENLEDAPPQSSASTEEAGTDTSTQEARPGREEGEPDAREEGEPAPEEDPEPGAPADRESGAQGGSEPATPPQPQPEKLEVRSGQPVGGVRTIRAKKGETVRINVASDVKDEVHVHGYDLFEDVQPGKAVRLEFKAEIEGIFEIELEKTKTEVAKLRVDP